MVVIWFRKITFRGEKVSRDVKKSRNFMINFRKCHYSSFREEWTFAIAIDEKRKYATFSCKVGFNVNPRTLFALMKIWKLFLWKILSVLSNAVQLDCFFSCFSVCVASSINSFLLCNFYLALSSLGVPYKTCRSLKNTIL